MSHWAAIVGRRSQGLANEIIAISERLGQAGLRVGGFVQHAPDDPAEPYTLCHLGSGERIALSSPAKPDAIAVCDYHFDPQSFETARRWALHDASCCDVLFVDQLGKLEVRGLGHAPALRDLLNRPQTPLLVLCIRLHQLVNVVNRLAPSADPLAHLQLPANDDAKTAFVDQLLRLQSHPARSPR